MPPVGRFSAAKKSDGAGLKVAGVDVVIGYREPRGRSQKIFSLPRCSSSPKPVRGAGSERSQPANGRITAINLDRGEIARGERPDRIRNHPALKDAAGD